MKIDMICRYPVKGLSPDTLQTVEVEAGKALPDDRRFALAHGASPIDPTHPTWQKKAFFLQLMSNAKLAKLETSYESETQTLTILRNGRRVAGGVMREPTGRAMVEQFFGAYMESEVRGSPKLVELADGTFSDVDVAWVSLINLASVRDVERVVGRSIDPMRFRGNLMIDGALPWAEMDWVGKKVKIGTAILEGMDPIGRCAATNVDPKTGERDMTIPRDLMRGFNHSDCGLYLKIVQSGTISEGDALELVG